MQKNENKETIKFGSHWPRELNIPINLKSALRPVASSRSGRVDLAAAAAAAVWQASFIIEHCIDTARAI